MMSHLIPWLTSFLEYALLMRVPVLVGTALFALPWLVQMPSLRALLLGLFDVTPLSTVAVTLASMSVAGIVADNARLIYSHAYDRGMGGLPHAPDTVHWIYWFALMLALSLPIIVFTIQFSNQENPGDLPRRILYAISTMGVEVLAQIGFVRIFGWGTEQIKVTINMPAIFVGYAPWKDHVGAAAGFSLALGVYIYFGWYGKNRLGKSTIVPALCSALMVLMLACSVLSALSFFLDLWHVPLLLVLIVWGLITAQSKRSDHFYELIPRHRNAIDAPTPFETLRATKDSHNGRIIVVAANGGGIQAAAWAAQVLEGLGEDSAGFASALRLISSVSGGSLGSLCYTHKQVHRQARGAFLAASKSSLDEVAWGLSWPDLISSVVPWITKNFIGRGRALERAWIANSKVDQFATSLLDQPLSSWNAGVKKGDLPAVIMNATLVESGQRLLLGTTRFSQSINCRARVDASRLHGDHKDVAAVTAARLSASFPLVTPAARSTADGLQPHVVDGGYYDNYGMSTLVEWLDEALCEDQLAAQTAVKSVLVIQVHGAPVSSDDNPKPDVLSERGWFFQIIAPLLTLANVRGAGQIAHNDLELGQLQQRWFGRVPIHSVTLEFPDTDAPLSWHLTRNQRECVLDRWVKCDKVQRGRTQVAEFLRGGDHLDCRCPTCQQHPPLVSVQTVA